MATRPRVIKPRTDEMERFWSKVDKTDSCWLWTGNVRHFGYGNFPTGQKHLENKKSYAAHRFLWERVRGPIPDGKILLHSCDNPRCVNPDHLSVGTKADNSADMVAKGRRRRGEANTKSKLTDKQVEEIRSQEGSFSQSQLARRYGVSQSQIHNILRRKRREHPSHPHHQSAVICS